MEHIRKQLYLTPHQYRTIKRIAQQQGITETELIGKAIDLFLAKEGMNPTEDPFSELIGMFEGPSEIDHNSIYME